jgi:hypothetical protein
VRGGVFVFLVVLVVVVVLGVLVMMMVKGVKHAVVFLGIFVRVRFGSVGMAGGVLLLVHADGVLGLVEEGLVSGAGGGGVADSGAGAAGAGAAGASAGVVVLDAGDLVGGGLGGGLVGVREDVTVEEEEVSLGALDGEDAGGREGGLPLDLVGDAGDGVGDLVGGGLGGVRGGVVGDLWEVCQPAMARGMGEGGGCTVVDVLAAEVRHGNGVGLRVVGWLLVGRWSECCWLG